MARGIGRYQIDSAIQLTGTFRAVVDNSLVDPTYVSMYLKRPDGTAVLLNYPADIVRISVGLYGYTFTPSQSGVWIYKFQGTGNVTVTSPDTRFEVLESELIAG